jgi:hypothetical protein
MSAWAQLIIEPKDVGSDTLLDLCLKKLWVRFVLIYKKNSVILGIPNHKLPSSSFLLFSYKK